MANTLTVTFNYMFLLVRNVKIGPDLQHVVFLPNGSCDRRLSYPHQLTWAFDDGPSIKSPQGDFTISGTTVNPPVKDGTDIPNLLHMKNVPGSDGNGKVRNDLFPPYPFPADLGGRVWLPAGGVFTADTTAAGYPPVQWNLCDHRTKKNLCQGLVDQLVYSIDFEKAYTIETPQGPQTFEDSLDLTFTNDEAAGSPSPVDWRILEDFLEMYRLCQRDATAKWPVPILDPSGFKTIGTLTAIPMTSDPERPICGGGQGCDPGTPGCP